MFLPPRPPAFLAGLGADAATAGAAAGSSLPAGEQPLQRQQGDSDQPLPHRVLRCGGAARVFDAGLVLGRCSSVLLGLQIGASLSWSWATAGALNSLDVRVILVGCLDCLQLRGCYLKESGFI